LSCLNNFSAVPAEKLWRPSIEVRDAASTSQVPPVALFLSPSHRNRACDNATSGTGVADGGPRSSTGLAEVSAFFNAQGGTPLAKAGSAFRLVDLSL
jgi:hypothetical protein